jgi:ketosteroid isomerase-like protein
LKRADAYNVCDVKTVYECYAENSEFVGFFPDLQTYKKQFEQLTKVYGSIKTEIIDENIKGNLAVVIYKDNVISEEGIITFYCKCYLKKDNSDWKILKEEKEIVESK